MRTPLICVALIGASWMQQAQAVCYTVYRQSNAIYRSTVAPVDLSQPLSDSVSAKFGPGTAMVTVLDETGCTEVSLPAGALPEGISRPDAGAPRASKTRNNAPLAKASAQPASLDGVFLDPSMQMRSSMGISSSASGPGVQKPVRR